MRRSLKKWKTRHLREIVGRYLYKLMAYKDEYEVARLLTKPHLNLRRGDVAGAGVHYV